MKRLLYIFIICSNFSFGQKNDNLNSFKEIPNDIDGCSCYFSFNKTDFENKKYFYVNNFANLAYIKINDTFLKFELIKHSEIKNKTIFLYKSGEYNLNIFVNESKDSNYESSLTLGRYEVLMNKKIIFSGEFYGECGC